MARKPCPSDLTDPQWPVIEILIPRADGGFGGELVHRVKRWYGRSLQIVKRTDRHKFKVLTVRWIVERTF